jgi:hypothetical protein
LTNIGHYKSFLKAQDNTIHVHFLQFFIRATRALRSSELRRGKTIQRKDQKRAAGIQMRNVSHPISSLTLHFVERRIRASLERTQFEVPDPPVE